MVRHRRMGQQALLDAGLDTGSVKRSISQKKLCPGERKRDRHAYGSGSPMHGNQLQKTRPSPAGGCCRRFAEPRLQQRTRPIDRWQPRVV